MLNVRKPKPRPQPSTLRELVLDLDHRMEGGDVLSDVWLPHEDWTRLVEQALEEHPVVLAAAASAMPNASTDSDALHVASLDAQLPGQKTQHVVLAAVLGVSGHTEWSDLLQIAYGYGLALDAERQRAQLAEEAALALAAPAEADEEPEHPECVHCGEADGHRAEDCANKGWAKPTPAELAAEAGLRLNGAGWKRHAKAAREANSLDVCHHCGGGDQIAIELMAFRHDDKLPDGVFCAGCRERLRASPAEWERHREGHEGRAARKTKKFPKGSGALEKCTVCGATQGDHAGQRCPPKQRALAQATSEGAPF